MPVAKNALNPHVIGPRGAGQNPDVLVLVHGFGSDQSVWNTYLPWLARHYRVITYDLPFTGSADPSFFKLSRHSSIEGHAQDLFDILRSFSVERCSFIGHSLGGLIGLFAAIDRPEMFERLILLGTSARYIDGPGYKGGFNAEMLEAMFEAVAQNFRAWAESYAPIAIGKPIEDPVAQTFLESLMRTRPDIGIAMARPIFLGDYREHVKQCTVPVVLLQTKEDQAVPIEAARALQECLPHCTLEILNATGHMPHLSAPYAVAAALRRHLPAMREPLPDRALG